LISQLYAREKLPTQARIFDVHLHPLVLTYIRSQSRGDFDRIEREWSVELHFVSRDDFHLEAFEIRPRE
jgi:hypothetical protein